MKLFIRLIALTALCLAAYAATAQQPPTPPKAPEAPQITDAHKAEFFRAQLKMQTAQQAIQAAQAMMQAAVAHLTEDCGKDYNAKLTADGEPMCEKKPSVTSKEEPAKK